MADEPEVLTPVPIRGTVRVDGSVEVTETAAEFGGYVTYFLAGTEAPQRILRQDANRARAYVTVTGTGPIWVGSEAACESIKAGQAQAGIVGAGLIATGITLPVTHQQELWMVGDGSHTATVTVSAERWA